MSKDFVLPGTTVEAFVQFLNGKPEETYGDKGSMVLDVLKRSIQLAIHDAIQSGDGMAEHSIDVDGFLLAVFQVSTVHFGTELAPKFGPPDRARFQAINWACCLWMRKWFGDFQQNKGTVSLFQTSQVPNLVQTLLEDIEKGDIPASENDDRILRISENWLLCMCQYIDEGARSTEPFLTAAVRGMNMQEALDGDLLDSEDWQQAWNQPFRGRALNALETKLQLNANAIRMDRKKADMSRIIPVVQASGTGKSRLAEEYGSFLTMLTCRFVRKNFGVMLSLRNGSGFPDCVYLVFLSSNSRTIMCRNISRTL